MSVILVVERDARHAQRISEALRANGLAVETTGSSEQALELARSDSPRLLLASSTLTRAPELLTAFSRSRGGPGAIALIREATSPGGSAAASAADEILTEPYSDDQLRDLVERCLEAAPDGRTPDPARKPGHPSPEATGSEQLTSDDIFGDVLAEVEAEAQRASAAPRARKPSIPMADIERKLEETLSGVLPLAGGKGRRPGVAGAADSGSAPRKRPELPDDSEIDALLEQTLSSLDIPTRSRKPTSERVAEAVPPTTPEPEMPTAQPDNGMPGLEPPSAPSWAGLGVESGPIGSLDELPPADQFRTQALPTLMGGRDEAAGETFGDYTLLDRIAIGGMAEVWRARRRGVEGFQKTVAIKKILSHLTGSPDFVTMFIDEAKLAAQLTHNNIIQIYDLGKVGNDFFIAMELVDGKDLRSILTAAQETGRPVPLGLGLFIISAVAQALDYAHRKRDFDNRAMGLVHRDVSPQNVLISREGAIKLCDFGIVKAVAKASTTQMGALKGKLQYMSPEQAWGKTVDARSDIFSLGSVLYEVLTGRQLFMGESEITVLDAVRECRLPSPREIVPEIPEEVELIVRKALAKTPQERYQTAGDMEREIKAALDDLRPAPSQKDLADYLRALEAPPDAAAAFEAAEPMAPRVVPAARDTADEAPPGPEAAAVPTTTPVGDASPVSETVPAGGPEPVEEPEPVAERDSETAAPTEAAGDDRAARGRSSKWLVAAIIVGALVALGLWLMRSQQDRDRPIPVPPPAEARTPEPAVDPAAQASETTAAATETADAPAAGASAAATEAERESTGGSGLATTGVDIERMVDQELSNRAEQLRRDFEAEKQRIEDELARTRAAGAGTPSNEAAEEDDEDDGGG